MPALLAAATYNAAVASASQTWKLLTAAAVNAVVERLLLPKRGQIRVTPSLQTAHRSVPFHPLPVDNGCDGR